MKISVALCTYNGAAFINKQLDSILNQKINKIDEIVICDDNSTDNTLEILDYYQQTYPDIFKVFKNEINIGSTKNFEKAIKFCLGDYIFFADQDDIWKEDKVQKILDVFKKNPDAEGVFSNADMVDKSDNLIANLTIWDSIFFLEKDLAKPIDFFDLISKNGNVVTGATLCIRNKIIDLILPLENDNFHDEQIAIQLALRKSLFYSTENLISYRIHDEQQIGMRNIYNITSKTRLKRIILGLEKPSTFKEYRYLSKNKYLKYHKSKKFQNYPSSKIDINDAIAKNHSELLEIRNKMKLKFPTRYQIFKISDKLRGKRQN